MARWKARERNGGVQTTGVDSEGISAPFDIRFSPGVEVLSAQELRIQWTEQHGTSVTLVRACLNLLEPLPSVPAPGNHVGTYFKNPNTDSCVGCRCHRLL